MRNSSWKSVQFLLLCCFLFLSDDGLYAQNALTLTGQIVDTATKEPLIGVTIQEKGTTNGGITDFNGNFSLKYLQVMRLSPFLI